MRIPTLQDEAVATPDGLKRVLQNPYLRQQYMIDADIQTTTMSAIYKAVAKKDKYGNIIYSPVGGKRRIDGILYRDDGSLVSTMFTPKIGEVSVWPSRKHAYIILTLLNPSFK